MNRITGSNFEDSLKSKLVNKTVYHESLYTRIFYFGQVINNIDPQNLNRVKIRIPIIDDIFYTDGVKEDGDTALPWALPISHRFIDIPEVNSIVVVSILDPKTPYYGRIYFDCVTELSTSDIFDRTTPEINSLSTWTNVEKAFKVTLNSKPANPSSYNATPNVNYNMGIRGKGNNKFELLQTSSIWTQNEGTDDYSYIQLSNNIDVQAANNINILSTAGYSQHYHPVFHTPLYNYLRSNFQMIQKIVILLTTQPALSPSGLCMPAPRASQLINNLASLGQAFESLEEKGNSSTITIN